jgi:hypothetical protein
MAVSNVTKPLPLLIVDNVALLANVNGMAEYRPESLPMLQRTLPSPV